MARVNPEIEAKFKRNRPCGGFFVFLGIPSLLVLPVYNQSYGFSWAAGAALYDSGSATMNFTETLAQITPAAEQSIMLPKHWGQGRALFGGITAAIAWQHAQYGAHDDQSVRSFSVLFVGPINDGEAQLTRRVLREGKSVSQIAVEIAQGGEVLLSALVSFGRGRESQVHVDALPAQKIPGPDQGPPMPEMKIVPEFTYHYDYRVSVGGLPFTGNPSRQFGGWMRFRDETAPINPGYLLGLVDAWPPAVLPHLTQPAPASSLTWTIEFIEPLPNKTSHDWWQYVAEIDYAEHGYGHTKATIYDDEGRLVALSRQTVTVFG